MDRIASLIHIFCSPGLGKRNPRCYSLSRRRAECVADLLPGSSVVEQATVNRLVAGSNPARGAISSFHIDNLFCAAFCVCACTDTHSSGNFDIIRTGLSPASLAQPFRCRTSHLPATRNVFIALLPIERTPLGASGNCQYLPPEVATEFLAPPAVRFPATHQPPLA